MLKILELCYFRAVVAVLLSCKEEKTCTAFYLSKLLLFVYFFFVIRGSCIAVLVKTARKAPHVMSLASVVTICGYNQAVNLDKETQTED